jgi:hypothetical protein
MGVFASHQQKLAESTRAAIFDEDQNRVVFSEPRAEWEMPVMVLVFPTLHEGESSRTFKKVSDDFERFPIDWSNPKWEGESRQCRHVILAC